jgi:hypothetical protein
VQEACIAAVAAGRALRALRASGNPQAERALPIAFNGCTTPDFLSSDLRATSRPFSRASNQTFDPPTPIRATAATEARRRREAPRRAAVAARAVITGYVDNQRVVHHAKVIDGLHYAAKLIFGSG